MTRILVDMNLSPGWVGRLGESGIEARHWSEVGEAVGPSVILLRMQDVLPETASSRVIGAIRALDDALRQGAIVTLSAAGSRVRVLPLQGN